MIRYAALLSVLLTCSSLSAQEDSPPADNTAHEPTAAQALLADYLDRIGQAMKESSAYQVSAKTTWESKFQDKSTSGLIHEQILRVIDGRLRVEVRPEDAAAPQLLVVSDGKTVTRWLHAEKMYAQDPATDPLGTLEHCAITRAALDMGGISFLLRRDLRKSIEAQLLRVVDLGDSEVAGEKCEHFELILQDGRLVDVWLQQEAPFVPLKLTTHREVSLPNDLKSTMDITTELTWDFAVKVTDSDFTVTIPADAKKVHDLNDGLLTGDSTALVGSPLPALKLQPLGKDQSEVFKVERPTVLYFWATWAAPSIDEIPRLNQFVEDMTDKQVDAVAINVAEQPAHVAEFVRLNGFKGSMQIDMTGDAVHALRLNHLPAVVLLDGEGKILAVKENSSKEYEQELRQAIDRLVADRSKQ